MQRRPVVSSNIVAIGYDVEQQVLEVEFSSGGVYQYMDVPQSVVDDLLAAPSIGQFFGQHIRNEYSTAKIS